MARQKLSEVILEDLKKKILHSANFIYTENKEYPVDDSLNFAFDNEFLCCCLEEEDWKEIIQEMNKK